MTTRACGIAFATPASICICGRITGAATATQIEIRVRGHNSSQRVARQPRPPGIRQALPFVITARLAQQQPGYMVGTVPDGDEHDSGHSRLRHFKALKRNVIDGKQHSAVSRSKDHQVSAV